MALNSSALFYSRPIGFDTKSADWEKFGVNLQARLMAQGLVLASGDVNRLWLQLTALSSRLPILPFRKKGHIFYPVHLGGLVT